MNLETPKDFTGYKLSLFVLNMLAQVSEMFVKLLHANAEKAQTQIAGIITGNKAGIFKWTYL